MYAIIFTLKTKQNNNEIKQELEQLGFKYINDNMYMSDNTVNSLTYIYKAINMLSKNTWFKDNVKYIKAFKVSDLSDFTDIIKS